MTTLTPTKEFFFLEDTGPLCSLDFGQKVFETVVERLKVSRSEVPKSETSMFKMLGAGFTGSTSLEEILMVDGAIGLYGTETTSLFATSWEHIPNYNSYVDIENLNDEIFEESFYQATKRIGW